MIAFLSCSILLPYNTFVFLYKKWVQSIANVGARCGSKMEQDRLHLAPVSRPQLYSYNLSNFLLNLFFVLTEQWGQDEFFIQGLE